MNNKKNPFIDKNPSYREDDWARMLNRNGYLCGKELAGAGKHGVIKNRNNPGLWGIKWRGTRLILSL